MQFQRILRFKIFQFFIIIKQAVTLHFPRNSLNRNLMIHADFAWQTLTVASYCEFAFQMKTKLEPNSSQA